MWINSVEWNNKLPLSKNQKEDILYSINNRFGWISSEHYDKSEVWLWVATGQQKIKNQIWDWYTIFETWLNWKRLEIINLYTQTLITLYRECDVLAEVAHEFKIDENLINPSLWLHQEDPQRTAMEEMGAKLWADFDERPNWEEFASFISSEVLALIDAKTRLKKSKTIEFNTPEEAFFFVLNLLWLDHIAAYLRWEGKRRLNSVTEREEVNIQIIIFALNDWELNWVLMNNGISLNWNLKNDNDCLEELCREIDINPHDLKKIKLIKKEEA